MLLRRLDDSPLPPSNTADDEQSLDDGTSLVVATLVIVLFVLSVFCQVYCLMYCSDDRHEGCKYCTKTSPSESFLHEMENGELPLSQVPKERRKEYMARVVIAKHAWLITTDKVQPNQCCFERKESLQIIQAPGDLDIDDTSHLTNAMQCAICLCPYQNGDDIWFSQNDQCHHVFHKRCLEEWLGQHDECPCCRIPYVRHVEGASDN